MPDTSFKPSLVGVHVVTTYLPSHSRPEDEQYTFAYTITISNNGELPVQLLSRHWMITDADNQLQEVRGEGVVGEQPIIEPGESHYYNSFCMLETPVGCMQGSYQMRGADGLYFDAPVAPFTLAVPGSLN